MSIFFFHFFLILSTDNKLTRFFCPLLSSLTSSNMMLPHNNWTWSSWSYTPCMQSDQSLTLPLSSPWHSHLVLRDFKGGNCCDLLILCTFFHFSPTSNVTFDDVHVTSRLLQIGVTFSFFRVPRNLAIGIGIQNFPEGLAVSLPLRGSGVSTWTAFWWEQSVCATTVKIYQFFIYLKAQCVKFTGIASSQLHRICTIMLWQYCFW